MSYVTAHVVNNVLNVTCISLCSFQQKRKETITKILQMEPRYSYSTTSNYKKSFTNKSMYINKQMKYNKN